MVNIKNNYLGRTNLKAEMAVEGGKHDWSDEKNGNRSIQGVVQDWKGILFR